jgi:hypothetical protein
MYPTEIRYPNNRYRVVFSQSDVRTDYDTAWDDDDSRVFYQKTRLDWISIEYNPDGDADFAGTELVRRYALTYASGSGHVFRSRNTDGMGDTCPQPTSLMVMACI